MHSLLPVCPLSSPSSDSRLDSQWQVQLDLLLSITVDWLSAERRAATRSFTVLCQRPCQDQTRQGKALWHEGDGWYSKGHEKKTWHEVDVQLPQACVRTGVLRQSIHTMYIIIQWAESVDCLSVPVCLSVCTAAGTRSYCHVNLSWEVWWLFAACESMSTCV